MRHLSLSHLIFFTPPPFYSIITLFYLSRLWLINPRVANCCQLLELSLTPSVKCQRECAWSVSNGVREQNESTDVKAMKRIFGSSVHSETLICISRLGRLKLVCLPQIHTSWWLKPAWKRPKETQENVTLSHNENVSYSSLYPHIKKILWLSSIGFVINFIALCIPAESSAMLVSMLYVIVFVLCFRGCHVHQRTENCWSKPNVNPTVSCQRYCFTFFCFFFTVSCYELDYRNVAYQRATRLYSQWRSDTHASELCYKNHLLREKNTQIELSLFEKVTTLCNCIYPHFLIVSIAIAMSH